MRHRRDSIIEHSKRRNCNNRHGDQSRNAESNLRGNKSFSERSQDKHNTKPNINNSWNPQVNPDQNNNWDQYLKPDQNNNWDQHVKPERNNYWDQHVKPDQNNNWDQHVKQDQNNNWNQHVKPDQNNNLDQHVKQDQNNNWDQYLKPDQNNNWDQYLKPDQNNNWDQHVKPERNNNWDQHVKPERNNNWDQHVKPDQNNNWDQHVKPDQNNNWDQHVKPDQNNNWDQHVKKDKNQNLDREITGTKRFKTNDRRPMHMFGNNDTLHETPASSDVVFTGPPPTLESDLGSNSGSTLPSFASTFFRSTPWANGPRISAVYSLPQSADWTPVNNVGNSTDHDAGFQDMCSSKVCLPDVKLMPPQLPLINIPNHDVSGDINMGFADWLQTPHQSTLSEWNNKISSVRPLDVIDIPLPPPPPPPPPQTPDQVVSTNTQSTKLSSNSTPSNSSGHSVKSNKERAKLGDKNMTDLNGNGIPDNANGPVPSVVYNTYPENDRFRKMEDVLHQESDETSRDNMHPGSNWVDFQNNSHVNSSRRQNVRNYERPHLRSAYYERPYLRSTISSTGVHNSRNFDRYEEYLANQQDNIEHNQSYFKPDRRDTFRASALRQAFHAIPLFPNADTPDEAYSSTDRNVYNHRRQTDDEIQKSGYKNVPLLLSENDARYKELHQPFQTNSSRKRTFEGKFRNPNTSSYDDSHFRRDARHNEVDQDRSRRNCNSDPRLHLPPHCFRPRPARSDHQNTARYVPSGGRHRKDGPNMLGSRNRESPSGENRSEHRLNRTNSSRNTERASEKAYLKNDRSDGLTNMSAPTTKPVTPHSLVHEHCSKMSDKPSKHNSTIGKEISQVDKNVTGNSLFKVEQSGQSHPKAERPGQSHPKAERPGQSHPKAERPGQSHPKAEQPGKSHPKAEQLGQSHTKAEQPGKSHPKAEQLGQSHPKAEQPGKSHPKAEIPGQGHPKAEQLGQSHPKAVQPWQPEYEADKPMDKVSEPFHKKRQDRYNGGKPYTDVNPVKREVSRHEDNRHWKKVRFATEICAVTSSTDKDGGKSESKLKSSACTINVPSTPLVKMEKMKPSDNEPKITPSVKTEMVKPSDAGAKITPSVKMEMVKPVDPEPKVCKSLTSLSKIVKPEICLDDKPRESIVKIEQDKPIRSISCFTIPRIKSTTTCVEPNAKADKKSMQKKTVRVSPLMNKDENDYEKKATTLTKSSTTKKEATSKAKNAHIGPKLNVLTTGQRKLKTKESASPAMLHPKLRHKTKRSSEKSTSDLLDKYLKDKSDNVETSFEDQEKQAKSISQNEMVNSSLNEPAADPLTEDECIRLAQLPCYVARGKFVMPTPSTYKVKDLNRQAVKRNIGEQFEAGSEMGADTFNKAMFSAKKHLLYRAMAVQALSRDKTKPVLAKKKGVRTSSITIDMAEREISKCTDAVLHEMGLVSKVKPNVDSNTIHTDAKNTNNNTGHSSDKNAKATKKSLAELDIPNPDYRPART